MATITTRCLKVAPFLKDLSEAAITELVALWVRVGELIDQYGCMNFTGASEHVFALNLTRVTGKRLIHGQCVGLGVVVMSLLQRNAPEVMAEAFVAAGARFKPTDIGCTWDDEHGLGFMVHGDRVVKLGGADTSFLEWVAERDVKASGGAAGV